MSVASGPPPASPGVAQRPAAAQDADPAGPRLPEADWPFYLGLGLLGGFYVLLVIALLVADFFYTTPDELWSALGTPEIRYAVGLSLISCSITAVLSLWVAVPLGYTLSRSRFRGKGLLDALLDIPIVLPPLVIGMSLLILFQTAPGRAIEEVTRRHFGYVATYFLLPPFLALAAAGIATVTPVLLQARRRRWFLFGLPLLGALGAVGLASRSAGDSLVDSPAEPMSTAMTYFAVPLAVAGAIYLTLRLLEFLAATRAWPRITRLLPWVILLATLLVLVETALGAKLELALQKRLGTSITYAVPSVILAQFAVSAAFAVRTMRVTFDQISPRAEQVALTLGCNRSQAFWWVALPEARRGVLAAATIAWARALGEFGPILIFSGATPMRTQVMSTTVYLELSTGRLEAAIGVSLAMVFVAVIVLIVTRSVGLKGSGLA